MCAEDSSAGSRHILKYCYGQQNINSGRPRGAVENLRKVAAEEARRRDRAAVTPERLKEMMRIVQDQRRAAALQRSPSPRKTPHKFRGATIYPPAPTTRVEVPVPTSPGF